MADYNAEAIKQLAADLYGNANVTVKDYAADYAAVSQLQQERQNAAAQEYGASIDALLRDNAAGMKKTEDAAVELSRMRTNAAPEVRTEQGAGIYGTAGTDLSESARILHDNALGNAMNEISAAQQTQAEQLETARRIAEYRRQQGIFEGLAELERQGISAQRAEDQAVANDALMVNQSLESIIGRIYGLQQGELSLTEQQRQNEIANQLARDQFTEQQRQFDAEYDLSNREFAEYRNQSAIEQELARLEFEEQQKQNTAGNQLNLSEFEERQRQNAYSNAMAEINTFGKVMTRAAAEALGVPIGTTAAYATANIAGKNGGGGGTPKAKDSGVSEDDYANMYKGLRENGMDSLSAYNKIMTEMEANGESKSLKNDLREFMNDYTKNKAANQETVAGNQKLLDKQKK